MSWGGPPAGSGFAGPSATQSSAAAGLPFAGVPEELQAYTEKILATEPDHPEPAITFRHTVADRRPFSLRRLLAPHRAGLALAGVLVVVETLAIQAGPLLTDAGIDDGILAQDVGALARIALIYAATVVVAILAGSWRVAWTARLGEGRLHELRVRVFSHLQRLSLDYYTDERSGRLMTRMTSDIEALSQLLQDGLVNLAVQGLTMLVVSIALIAIQPTLALITLLVVVPAMTVLTLWFRRASDRGYMRVRERIAEVLADLAEGLGGIRVITAFNRRRHNITAHRNLVGQYRDANVYTARINAFYGPATDLVGVAGQLVVLAVGGSMVLDGRLSIGGLTAFILYLTAFFAPIQQLVQLYTTYQSGQAAVAKLRELLATQPTVEEAPDAVELPPIEGAIELRDVSFAYEEGQPVLERLDLVVRPGETLALVGPTGAGKSTLAKLVARFYDPTAGAVLIDGHDLRTVTLTSLRGQLGVVPQEPFLFVGTMRDNLAFARPDAGDDEILAAARAVGLGELLERLPDGLDTAVHERGSSLSSGERQLLALARAFLARPRVLVLDEATSSLDLKSEARVEHALDVVLEGRTAIVIAHRLATAQRADRIAVVDHRGIVELGSHDELVARDGEYAQLYAAWARHAHQ
jgi:ATP-binding cassette subfamily B protein